MPPHSKAINREQQYQLLLSKTIQSDIEQKGKSKVKYWKRVEIKNNKGLQLL